MIAGVSAPHGAVHLPSILTKLGALGGRKAQAEVSIAGGSAVLAWVDASSHVDAVAGVAWTGRVGADLRALPTDVGGVGGAFALAVATDGALILARSLFGGRSMYFARDAASGGFLACSRLGPLVGSLGDAPQLDVTRLAGLMLTVRPPDEGSTVFRGIRRVLPGETLSLGCRGDVIGSRADLLLPDVGPQDWAAELRAQFERAVQRATSGCKRVGVLVSGGLDSSAVLAALVGRDRGASGRKIEDILAVTLDFDARHSDRPYLSALVEALGIVPVRVAPRECAPHAFPSLVIDASPRAWPSAAMDVHLLEIARASGADIVLTGVGGDFFFDFEQDSLGERALAGDVFGAMRDAAALRAVYWKPTRRQRIRDFVVRPLIRGLLPQSILRGIQHARRSHSRHGPHWAGPALRSFAADAYEASISAASPRGREARMSELAHSAVLADVGDAQTQLEVYSGCRVEHVFFDADFARFLASMPSRIVLQDGWLRGVVRAAFADVWPECIRSREDKGDFEPAFACFLGGLRASGQLDRLLRMEALGDLGLVEPRRFRESFERLTDNPDDGGAWPRYWPALAIEEFAGRRDATATEIIGLTG